MLIGTAVMPTTLPSNPAVCDCAKRTRACALGLGRFLVDEQFRARRERAAIGIAQRVVGANHGYDAQAVERDAFKCAAVHVPRENRFLAREIGFRIRNARAGVHVGRARLHVFARHVIAAGRRIARRRIRGSSRASVAKSGAANKAAIDRNLLAMAAFHKWPPNINGLQTGAVCRLSRFALGRLSHSARQHSTGGHARTALDKGPNAGRTDSVIRKRKGSSHGFPLVQVNCTPCNRDGRTS